MPIQKYRNTSASVLGNLHYYTNKFKNCFLLVSLTSIISLFKLHTYEFLFISLKDNVIGSHNN